MAIDTTVQCKLSKRNPHRPGGPCPTHADYTCLQPTPEPKPKAKPKAAAKPKE